MNTQRVKNKFSANKFSAGFTLLELVLVIGLLAVAFGVTSDILISLIRSQTKTQTMMSVEQQANFVSLKLEKDLKNATDVVMNGSVLQISKKGATYPIQYNLNAMVLSRSENNPSTPTYLPLNDTKSPGGVGVQCNPTCFTVTLSDPKIVTIALRFSPVITSGALVPVNTGTVDINDTIVIRSTY